MDRHRQTQTQTDTDRHRNTQNSSDRLRDTDRHIMTLKETYRHRETYHWGNVHGTPHGCRVGLEGDLGKSIRSLKCVSTCTDRK
jgi:hypothetical protein